MFILTFKKLNYSIISLEKNPTLQNLTYELKITKKCVRYIVSIHDLSNTKNSNLLQLMVLGCTPLAVIRTDSELPKKLLSFASFILLHMK